MLGIRFIKAQPTTYLIQYRGGHAVREGAGLAFFYYAPTSSLVSVPMASTDAPFIFSRFANARKRGPFQRRHRAGLSRVPVGSSGHHRDSG
jgi:hypothetical protein